MLRPGTERLQRTRALARSLGIESRKDALLLALLLTLTSSAVVVGVGLQIAPARKADGNRAREIEALFARIRAASCSTDESGRQRQAQIDAQPEK